MPLYQHPVQRVITLVKGRSGAAEMVRVLRKQIDPADTTFTLVPPRAYDDLVTVQFAFLNTLGRVLATAGSFGLSLAVIGIYGVVSFAVSRRGREIAVRKAVGARPGRLVRAVSRDAMLLAIAGIALGTGLAITVSALLRADFDTMSPFDPVSTMLGAGLLVVAAWIACLVPALRVTRIDPVEALRSE